MSDQNEDMTCLEIDPETCKSCGIEYVLIPVTQGYSPNCCPFCGRGAEHCEASDDEDEGRDFEFSVHEPLRY